MNILIERWLKNRKNYKWENTNNSNPNMKEDTDTCLNEDKTLSPPNPPPKRKKRRYYHDNYIAFGFVCSTQHGDLQRPLCILCRETLANESMRPAKLRRHLEAKHKEHSDKPVEYFLSRQQEMFSEEKKPTCKPKITTTTTAGRENENAVLASYDVSLLIANSGIPHTIAEEIILPSAKAIACRMHGPKAANVYNTISLSNTTVKRRIENMAENVKNILLTRMQASQYYSLLLDETTDVCDKAYLLLFVRYEYQDKINEDFLFCQSLPVDATCKDIFITVNDFILANRIGWRKCVGVCTDGSLTTSRKYQELLVKIQSLGSRIKLTHCCVRRSSLAVRQMPIKLKKALDEVIQVVNFIKPGALNSHIINILCQEMGSAHEQLLTHSQVHWLSQGKVLTRMFDLRDEIRLILREKAFPGIEWFSNFSWLAMVAYLSDIFAYLNDMHLSLQGKTITIFQVQDKVECLIVKLELWSGHFQSSMFESFPTLSDFLTISQTKLSDELKSIFIEHLQNLKNSLRDYFPVLDPSDMWIRNPFMVDVNEIKGLSADERNSFVGLSQDVLLKSHFGQCSLWDFWSHTKTEHPELASKALRYLMPFATTYLYEQALSQLIFIKSKHRTRMNVEPDLRLKLATIDPEIETIVSLKQHQPSH